MTQRFSICDGWLQEASHCVSPNFNLRPEQNDISLLVVHNISLPPGEFGGGYIEQFFQNQLDPTAHPYFEEIHQLQVSAHALVKRDGEVVQFVSFDQRAWHAGASEYKGRKDCNDFSIGIELEGTDDVPFTDEQYLTLNALREALCATYPNLKPENTTGHSDIAPGRKTDPGPAFDWQRLN